MFSGVPVPWQTATLGAGALEGRDPCFRDAPPRNYAGVVSGHLDTSLLEVPANATLTIAAGTCVVVDTLRVAGTLVVNGGPAAPVHFVGGSLDLGKATLDWTFLEDTSVGAAGRRRRGAGGAARRELISSPPRSMPTGSKPPSRDDAPAPIATAADVRALRVAGRHDEHVIAARRFVAEQPSEALAQLEAAYGSDRAGDEHAAIRHYDEAHRLGVPAAERRRFLVGYGSTLRNVGRVDDAVALLAEAVAADPDYPAYGAFLALALHTAGHPRAALAAMLGCALDVARADGFDGYERALAAYQLELLAPPP